MYSNRRRTVRVKLQPVHWPVVVVPDPLLPEPTLPPPPPQASTRVARMRPVPSQSSMAVLLAHPVSTFPATHRSRSPVSRAREYHTSRACTRTRRPNARHTMSASREERRASCAEWALFSTRPSSLVTTGTQSIALEPRTSTLSTKNSVSVFHFFHCLLV